MHYLPPDLLTTINSVFQVAFFFNLGLCNFFSIWAYEVNDIIIPVGKEN